MEVLARGELGEVFAVPGGGRFLVGEHVRPVRTIDREWMAIDAALPGVAVGVTPGVTTAGVIFSVGGTGPMVALTRADETVSLTGRYKRPETTLKGDLVGYASALPGIGVVLSVDKGGFSRVLMVKTTEAGQDS